MVSTGTTMTRNLMMNGRTSVNERWHHVRNLILD
jgi:hypothetical protein